MSAIDDLRDRFGPQHEGPAPRSQEYSPSRIKYRMERIWLTPLYKSLIRTGVPLILVLAVAANYFAQQDTQMRWAQSITNAKTMIEDRPEFAVKLMQIKGASTVVAEQVREAVPMEFPVSSMRLDLAVLKERIESVDAVKRADVFLRNGVLDVEISERVPALIWRGETHLELVDPVGERAGVLISREGYHGLPLILGRGAQAHAEEALALLAAAKPIASRVRGLRRMGERRWDVMLDRQQIIQLPVQDPVQALERVIALHSARDVLGRDVTVVDMRDGRRPVLRLSVPAVDELYRLRAIADGEEET